MLENVIYYVEAITQEYAELNGEWHSALEKRKKHHEVLPAALCLRCQMMHLSLVIAYPINCKKSITIFLYGFKITGDSTHFFFKKCTAQAKAFTPLS
jgi:hypothetical protein